MRGIRPTRVHDLGGRFVEQFVLNAPVGQVEVVLGPFDLDLAALEPIAGQYVLRNQGNLRSPHADLSVADLHVVVVPRVRDFTFQQLTIGQKQ